jgi:hypothetical protein
MRGRDGTASNVRRSARVPVTRCERRSSCRADLHPLGYQFRLTDGRATPRGDARPIRTGVQSSLPFSRSIRVGHSSLRLGRRAIMPHHEGCHARGRGLSNLAGTPGPGNAARRARGTGHRAACPGRGGVA